MSQLLLWADADVAPKRGKKVKPVTRGRLCGKCLAKIPPKPRTTMPLTHAFETVQGILIDRLDAMTDSVVRIVGDEVSELLECEHAVLARIAGRIVDALNYRLFPDAYDDGAEYTPDPSGRMDVPVNHVGLIPKLPTIAIYAKHLLALGKASPAAALTISDGEGNPAPLFTDAELERLGARIERREGRSVG